MAEKNRTATQDRAAGSESKRAERGNGFGQARFGAKMFEDALASYEQALKAGLRLQEETSKLWGNFLNEANAPNYWQRTTGLFGESSFGSAQRKMMEQTLEVVEENSRRSLELLKKAGELGSSTSARELQQKLQNLWEDSLQILRSNTAAVVDVNTRALDTWMQFMRRQAEEVREHAAH